MSWVWNERFLRLVSNVVIRLVSFLRLVSNNDVRHDVRLVSNNDVRHKSKRTWSLLDVHRFLDRPEVASFGPFRLRDRN